MSFPRGVSIGIILASLAGATTVQAAIEPERLVVWDFNHNLTSSLGGPYNAFSKSPSWARTYLDQSVHLASSAHSLRVTAHRDAGGFCGVWFDFYPDDTTSQRVLDASAYRFLSFWIRGSEQSQGGSAGFDIKLVDEAGEAHEDSILAEPVDPYLAGGISPEWRRVLVPLADFPGVDPARLVRLVLVFTRPGDYRFYLDDISFVQQSSHDDLAVRGAPVAAPRPSSAPVTMWVWNTLDLLDSPENAKRFFEFCARENVADVYLALVPEGSVGTDRFTLTNAQTYRALIASAHHQGLRVEALAGSPEWAVAAHHHEALAAVRTILDFNRLAPPAARFDGMHLDVEPYALPGFADHQYQKELLTEFLRMVAQCAELARTGHLALGCDAPWWFYPADPRGRAALSVRFQGQEKTVGEHLTDLLDSVTIMDYHNEADGAAGVIASGGASLRYAAAKGKRVVVGVETSREPDTVDYFAFSLPKPEFHQRLSASGLGDELQFDGYHLYASGDGPNVLVGLWWPASAPPEEALGTALARLARKLGFIQPDCCSALAPAAAEIRALMGSDAEWTRMDVLKLRDPESREVFAGFRLAHRMGPDTTFDGLGPEIFDEETRSAIEWLSAYPSFGGLAVHYYDSFRKLMEAPTSQSKHPPAGLATSRKGI